MARGVFVASAAALLCALVAVAVGGPATRAMAGDGPTPPGPRLAVGVVHVGYMEISTELLTIGPAGEAPQMLAHGTGFPGSPDFGHPNWNADGTELAFFGPGHGTNAVFAGGADGRRLRLLADSEKLGGRAGATLPEPLFDPRTGELVVSVIHIENGGGPLGDARPPDKAPAFRREFWVLPVDGSKPHRLSSRTVTRAHALILYPYSIAPSGMVAATRLGRSGFGVVMVDPRNGRIRTVVPTTKQKEGSLQPALSPDGKEIVYKVDQQKGPVDKGGLISTDLMVVPTAGGKPKLLARVQGGAAWPSWDPSGSRIAFTTLNAGGVRDAADPSRRSGNSLMEINVDGSCLTNVYSLGRAGVIQGAAWQPGADRGAGPISC